jgi:hypothetical protein
VLSVGNDDGFDTGVVAVGVRMVVVVFGFVIPHCCNDLICSRAFPAGFCSFPVCDDDDDDDDETDDCVAASDAETMHKDMLPITATNRIEDDDVLHRRLIIFCLVLESADTAPSTDDTILLLSENMLVSETVKKTTDYQISRF